MYETDTRRVRALRLPQLMYPRPLHRVRVLLMCITHRGVVPLSLFLKRPPTTASVAETVRLGLDCVEVRAVATRVADIELRQIATANPGEGQATGRRLLTFHTAVIWRQRAYLIYTAVDLGPLDTGAHVRGEDIVVRAGRVVRGRGPRGLYRGAGGSGSGGRCHGGCRLDHLGCCLGRGRWLLQDGRDGGDGAGLGGCRGRGCGLDCGRRGGRAGHGRRVGSRQCTGDHVFWECGAAVEGSSRLLGTSFAGLAIVAIDALDGSEACRCGHCCCFGRAGDSGGGDHSRRLCDGVCFGIGLELSRGGNRGALVQSSGLCHSLDLGGGCRHHCWGSCSRLDRSQLLSRRAGHRADSSNN